MFYAVAKKESEWQASEYVRKEKSHFAFSTVSPLLSQTYDKVIKLYADDVKDTIGPVIHLNHSTAEEVKKGSFSSATLWSAIGTGRDFKFADFPVVHLIDVSP